jgi:hypothetical protein
VLYSCVGASLRHQRPIVVYDNDSRSSWYPGQVQLLGPVGDHDDRSPSFRAIGLPPRCVLQSVGHVDDKARGPRGIAGIARALSDWWGP